VWPLTNLAFPFLARVKVAIQIVGWDNT